MKTKSIYFRSIKDLIKKVIKKIFLIINNTITFILRVLPIQENTIVLESEGDYWDNARAFYEYLIDNKINKEVKIVWIVREPSKYPKRKNVHFVSRHASSINFMTDYYIATSKCFLFTHPYWLKNWRRDQVVINLTHSSMMLKAGGKNISNCFDYMLCASEAVKERKRKTYYINENQAVILGSPRMDLLFKESNCIKKIIPHYSGEKIVLSMTTFKQTKSWSDSSSNDKYAINVVNTFFDLLELNDFLEKNNIYLLVKIHHLQDMSFIEVEKLSKIIYLQDKDLQSRDIQLYELLSKVDILLTDYSSVFYDYLILDRPIGFLIADINDYSRGFCIDDPMIEMVGEKISNLSQLFVFLRSKDKAKYVLERENLKNTVHKYQDNKNCERLFSWLIKENLIK